METVPQFLYQGLTLGLAHLGLVWVKLLSVCVYACLPVQAHLGMQMYTHV